jgi:hypothetical protein
MKKLIKSTGLLTVILAFVSCTSEQEKKAERLTDNYIRFVDSVAAIPSDEAAAKWNEIEKIYDNKTSTLNTEVDKLENKAKLDKKINEAVARYENFKILIIEKKVILDANNEDLKEKKVLFGADYVSDNFKFEWVNKDNILAVYDHFVTTVSKYKDAYSREDWDEIKMLYEALDTRKNTVENEGLTGSDNRKIAMLKIKFAPMFTFNRMGAKSDENATAKK